MRRETRNKVSVVIAIILAIIMFVSLAPMIL